MNEIGRIQKRKINVGRIGNAAGGHDERAAARYNGVAGSAPRHDLGAAAVDRSVDAGTAKTDLLAAALWIVVPLSNPPDATTTAPPALTTALTLLPPERTLRVRPLLTWNASPPQRLL
jgi:hypothetical protein